MLTLPPPIALIQKLIGCKWETLAPLRTPEELAQAKTCPLHWSMRIIEV